MVAPWVIMGVSSTSYGVEGWANLTNEMLYGKQDFLFSYGPLFWINGFSAQAYSTSTYIISFIFITIYYAIFWTLLIELSLKYKVMTILLLVYTFFMRSFVFHYSEVFFLLPVLLLYYFEFYYGNKLKILNNIFVLLLIGFYCAALFYMRFLFGVIASLVFTTYFISLIFEGLNYKKVFLYFSFLFLAYIFLGLVVFHQSKSIYDYLFINYQLSFSNSIDMNEDFKTKWLMWVLIAVIFFVQAYAFRNKKVLLLPLSIVFYMLFKLGFSRVDHYGDYFIFPMAILSLGMLFTGDKRSKSLCLLVLILLLLVAKLSPLPGSWFYSGKWFDYWFSLSFSFIFPLIMLIVLRKLDDIKIKYQAWLYPLILAGLGCFVLFSPYSNQISIIKALRSSYQDRMANLDADFKLNADVIGLVKNNTIDVYPYANEFMFANKFNYFHRPLFQNFMTLTPGLDKLNQGFYEQQDSRPEFVLWTGPYGCFQNNENCNFVDIDINYTLNLDPLTTTSIMLNYHIVDKSISSNNIPVLVLQQNTGIQKLVLQSIGVQRMVLNQWFDVPQQGNMRQGIIKLIPNFKFTLLGKIKNKLFRGAILYVNYKLQNGEVVRYRLHILNAQSGIWVSPYFSNFDFVGKNVSQIMIEYHGAYYLENVFLAEWVLVNINMRNFTRDYSAY